ncbi:MAG: plastocyanin/azurin family copper-binding protein [Balneolales bacterium]
MKKIIEKAVIAIFALIILYPVTGFSQDDVRTIELEGLDNMRYDKELIEAEPGEEIRIVFTTVSDLPPEAMQHNVVIMTLEADVSDFAMASMMSPDNGYIAPDRDDEYIARTEMTPGGETSEITFTVPEETGDYEYICTFPGHYMSGMVGILQVRD